MSIDIRYVCTGGCGKRVKEEEFKEGENKCQDKKCSHHQEELEKRKYCTECDRYFLPSTDHSHKDK